MVSSVFQKNSPFYSSDLFVHFLLFFYRHRAEFLGHMKPCESQSSAASGPESGNWTLVDEGGEEVTKLYRKISQKNTTILTCNSIIIYKQYSLHWFI